MQTWFVLLGSEKTGPFNTEEIVTKLQSRTLFSFDYVWASGLDAWTPIADIPEFSEARIARLAFENKNSSLFIKRSSPRVETNIEVMYNDGVRFGYGRMDSLSLGGAKLEIESPIFLPESKLFVHCRGIEGVIQPFNCEFLITNKSFARYRIQHNSRLHYSGAFSKIPVYALEQIRSMIEQNQKQGGL